MKKVLKRKIMDNDDIRRTIERLAFEILEKHREAELLALIGVRTRGAPLARRIKKILDQKTGIDIPLGVLDITLYRDDLQMIGEKPEIKSTLVDFDVTDKEIVLVDDVLFTGRTVRSAFDAIMDFGRPKRIELLVLIDRGHRELPIQADYVGRNMPTSRQELVEVKLKEVDGEDEVSIGELVKEKKN